MGNHASKTSFRLKLTETNNKTKIKQENYRVRESTHTHTHIWPNALNLEKRLYGNMAIVTTAAAAATVVDNDDDDDNCRATSFGWQTGLNRLSTSRSIMIKMTGQLYISIYNLNTHTHTYNKYCDGRVNANVNDKLNGNKCKFATKICVRSADNDNDHRWIGK